MAYSFAAHLARFGPDAVYSTPDLAEARSYCASLTRSHYENFTVASAFLPRQLVRHFFAVYAFCRWADDLGDETGGGERSLSLLAWWRGELLDCYAGRVRHPVMVALRPTIERFRIPPEPFLDLISAFEADQTFKRCRTFDELLNYCRCSANPVGRLVLALGGCLDDERAALADHICTGLQLANFWQDVARDHRDLDRVYLPEEDRRRFGWSDDDLKELRPTPAFRELMRFQVERSREYFERGRPLLGLLPSGIRLDVSLFLEGGLAILRKIEECDFDVLSERPKLCKSAKVRLIVRAIWQALWRKSSSAASVNHVVKIQTRVRSHFSELPIAAARSYRYCQKLTRRTARNFRYAFQVLPSVQRKAMDALYAFMRVTDDLADDPGNVDIKRRVLSDWRVQLDNALTGIYTHPLHAALHDTIRRHQIPVAYLHAVIDGVTMDLQPAGFATFDDLYGYNYRVASAVGLACIHIWGFHSEKAQEHAEAAGIAFQLTNILRDLGEDLDLGRVYLPREDIERFECPPEIWHQRPDSFSRLMRFQVERALEYYRGAEPLSGLLSTAGRAVFQVMMRIYRGLLEEIIRRDYDVFSERVRLSGWRKLGILLRAFPVRWGWL